MIFWAILFIIIGYACGSIPFSYLLPKKFKGIDIREKGSGNVGGTNALRNFGPIIGLSCMLLDILKSVVPVVIASAVFGLDSWIPYLTGIAAVIGHDYTIFLNFEGGKGVATTLGSYFGWNPLLGMIFFCVWLPVILVTQYVSLGSILALVVNTLIAFTLNWKLGVASLLLCALSAYRHKENIERLMKGKENRTDLIKLVFKR